jgi:hypothetical protein
LNRIHRAIAVREAPYIRGARATLAAGTAHAFACRDTGTRPVARPSVGAYRSSTTLRPRGQRARLVRSRLGATRLGVETALLMVVLQRLKTKSPSRTGIREGLSRTGWRRIALSHDHPS